MARDKVQFQQGLSERHFRDSGRSEDQYRVARFARRWPKGFDCPRCGGARRQQLSLTAYRLEDMIPRLARVAPRTPPMRGRRPTLAENSV